MVRLLLEKSQSMVDSFDTANRGYRSDFNWTDAELFHSARRKKIIKAHPEIKKLYGREWNTFPIVLLLVFFYFCLSVWVTRKSIFHFFFFGYFFGGTFIHSLQLAAHELSHNLCFESATANKLLAIFSNLPSGIPSAITFQRYHIEHHNYHTVDEIDTDIPTFKEGRIFRTKLFKIIWVFLLPLFYSIRPLFVRPKRPRKWEVVNFIIILFCDSLVVWLLGVKALLFSLYCTVICMGLHPAAGHFIAEHFEFVLGVETYSYYGPMNYLNFNVGYHNEHHDFPMIPWSRLPEVNRIAREFYVDLPCYSSYLKVFYYYIMSPSMGPFSRVRRKNYSKSK